VTDHSSGPSRPPRDLVDIDHTVAHASRVYDYLVGGSVNFAADREAAEHMTAGVPGGIEGARSNARTNRLFLGQAVRYLGQRGVRQFLDIGPGIPTVNQTHEVAQSVAPESRIVYVDNDPIVLAHAHTLLEGTDEGSVVFLREDLRNPDAILALAGLTLDFDQPIALMLVAILHMIPDADQPHAITHRLVEALPRGSYVVLSHLTADFLPDLDTSITRLSERTREAFVSRSRDELAPFLDGLDLVEPGIVQIDEWLRRGPLPPAADAQPSLTDVHPPEGWINTLYAAIAHKP
jgi:hypothetical protein